MNELTIINHEGKLVADSREVAAMVEKDHKNLMRDIKGYIETLAQPNELNFEPVNFFIESTYQDNKGETRPCYLLTRKGCDMVANKMTGEKGVRFTATYIDRFYEMEHALTTPKELSPLDLFAQSVAAMQAIEAVQKEQSHAIAAVNQRVDTIGDIIALNPNNWRKDGLAILRQIAYAIGDIKHVQGLQADVYKLIDERFAVKLKTRLTNMKRIAAENGMCKSKRENLNYLDVIADDPKLIEAYVILVKEMAIKYGLDKEAKSA